MSGRHPAAAPDVPARPLPETGLRLLRPIASRIMARRWDIRERGAHHVPERGPVIFASNHIGWLDGPLLVGRAPRPAHALTKREAFEGALGVLLRLTGQIRVDREANDVGALRTAAGALAAGQSVVVFPEAVRGSGDFAVVKPGIGWLALVSGAPVVPVVLVGTRGPGQHADARPQPGARFHVLYGRPVTFPAQAWPRPRETVDAVTDQIQQHLREHLERALRTEALELPGPLPAEELHG
ncbi:hypothetical protein GCM10009821_02640 [Aeromicrobium halocynthiae]|uniref:Phospholipid/glycerol acyltransferase domain-containing protein n=1 Tax=Aeromicrobium halocynthiae TaxID=560557 RepID=A0ABN2VRB7_9ACTN